MSVSLADGHHRAGPCIGSRQKMHRRVSALRIMRFPGCRSNRRPINIELDMVMNFRLAIVLLFAGLSQSGRGQTPASPDTQISPRTIGDATQQNPKYIPGGFDLPNGWRITPAGKVIATVEDMVLNTVISPDGKTIVATHSGYLPHGIDVIDVKTRKLVQQIPLKTTWLGLAWSSDGHTLYVSGGNATGAKNIAASMAPIYEFTYKDGRLSEKPTGSLVETIDANKVWWSGVAYLP